MRGAGYLKGIVRWLSPFAMSTGGNVAIMTALAMPALGGALGLGLEVWLWHMTSRSMQNAADSGAIAAAMNGGSTAKEEAKAIVASYQFVDGTDNVAVTVSDNIACPSGGANCYSVKIEKYIPLYLSKLVGYTGTTVVDGKDMQRLATTSVSLQAPMQRQYCVLALAASGARGIRTNGAPMADLPGCNLMSNTAATCNGHDLKADVGDAYGVNDGCGIIQHSNVPKIVDPYSQLASNIPSDTCGGVYPQIPGKSGPSLPSSNRWSGTMNLTGYVKVCGDLQMTGNVTVNAPTSAVLVIYNGRLDTNGYTLQTSDGSALTIVFAGTNGSYVHAPTGGGMLDVAAPTSGTWKGVAIYQDPNLTAGVDIAAAGNEPAWKLTGLVYVPHASVDFRGVVNKASYGHSCFGLVVDNLIFSGTSAIFAHGECPRAGLDLPYNIVLGRGTLVR